MQSTADKVYLWAYIKSFWELLENLNIRPLNKGSGNPALASPEKMPTNNRLGKSI